MILRLMTLLLICSPQRKHFGVPFSEVIKSDILTIDTIFIRLHQILRDVWKIACSLPSQSKILMPKESSYLIGPIDFSGPCQSTLTLRVGDSLFNKYFTLL